MKSIKFLLIIIAAITIIYACKPQEIEPKADTKISTFIVSKCKTASVNKVIASELSNSAITAKTVGNNLQITITDIYLSCALEEIQKTINTDNNVIGIDLIPTGEMVRSVNCICPCDIEMLLEELTFGTTYTINITLEGRSYYLFSVTFENSTNLNFDLNADSEIKIRMQETLGETDKHLIFHCLTKTAYPCINFPVIYSKEFSNNDFIIHFDSVRTDVGICLTAVGPASATIDLGTLNNATYNLHISDTSLNSIGTLIVTDEKFEINIGNGWVPQTVLNRIPQNTIWGTIGYHQQSTINIVDNFIDSLIFTGAVSQTYLPGHYSEFDIDNNGHIVQPENSGYHFAKTFIFNYSGSSSAI